jgi:hypothetical protein
MELIDGCDVTEALWDLRSIADNIDDIGTDLHSRLSGDDVPMRVQYDVSEEYGSRLDDQSRELKATEKLLKSGLQQVAKRLRDNFDPGGNLPEDCAEWASKVEAAIADLELIAEV